MEKPTSCATPLRLATPQPAALSPQSLSLDEDKYDMDDWHLATPYRW